MSDLLIKIGTIFTGDAAIKKAEKSFKTLGKTVTRMTIGGTGAAGFALFAKRSVDAFLQSERAAKSLNSTLSSLGMAYQQEAASKFVDNLSVQYGIVDEQLNPALQTLLLNTRDLTKAQSLLNTAIDVSAGTSIDLQTVSDALSKAYVGNRTALAKLNIGISAAAAKSASFDDILKALNDQFSGQGAIAADTYSGKIDRMSIAVDHLQEAFGKSLVQGLADTDGSLESTIKNMELLGMVGGEAIRAILSPLNVVTTLFQKDTWTKFADQFGNKPTDLVNTGGDRGGKAKAAEEKYNSQIKKQQESMTRLQKQQVDLQKKSLAEQKKQAALKKSAALLDIEQIQILAALQGKLSENEKLRLQLQMALLQDNAVEAERLAKELAMSQLQTTGLAGAIANLPKALNPFEGWDLIIAKIKSQVEDLARVITGAGAQLLFNMGADPSQIKNGMLTTGGYNGITDLIVPRNNPNFGQSYEAQQLGLALGFTPMTSSVNVYVEGSVVSNTDLTDYIRSSLLDSSASGSFASIGTNGRVRDY